MLLPSLASATTSHPASLVPPGHAATRLTRGAVSMLQYLPSLPPSLPPSRSITQAGSRYPVCMSARLAM